MVAACRGVAEARRDSGREARFHASGGHSVRGEERDPMKKLMSGLAIAAIASSAFVGAALADDRADSGNGGVSTSDSSGGAVTVGDAGNGGNVGSTSVINAGELLGSEDLAASIIAAVLAAQAGG
jgi:hypothetical protein